MGKIVAIVVIVLLLASLAVVLIRFNRKRIHIIKRAASATEAQLERIYCAIENKNGEPPTCAVLGRTNRTVPAMCAIIPIPEYVRPWAGKSIVVTNNEKVALSLPDVPATEATIAGKVFRLVPIPRQQTKTGKSRNLFSPKRYIAADPELMAALTDVCPRYPLEVLAYLLSAGIESFEFDPINQARIGGSPSWTQDAEFVNCSLCKKRMSMVLQLPGTLLPVKTKMRATFYLFGCPTHTEQSATVVQYD